MNLLTPVARRIPVRTPTPTLSVDPVTLEAIGRPRALEMRVTAPIQGRGLPVVLLSHGMGPSYYLASKDGYAPLSSFLAARGFVVVQPTHGNSPASGFGADAPGAPLFWRERVEDFSLILDRWSEIEREVPGLSGRVDASRVGAVGHSMGGQTVGMLLGAQLSDPKDASAQHVSLLDDRVRAGVLLAAPGRGEALSPYAKAHFSALHPDYTHMTTPALVVVGDSDLNPFMTVQGPEWYLAPYEDAPGAQALLTLRGGQHGLGGIAGWDAKETADEDPERLALVQRMTWAWLESQLNSDVHAWESACAALDTHARELADLKRRRAGF